MPARTKNDAPRNFSVPALLIGITVFVFAEHARCQSAPQPVPLPAPQSSDAQEQRRVQERERVLRETISGGVSVNNVLMHFACDDLPFGGVGNSGIGHYHGREGFRTFSHAKSVYQGGWLNVTKLAGTLPPFGPKFAKMLDGMIKK